MNKSELIDALADRLGVGKKEAQTAVDAVLDTITRAVVAGSPEGHGGYRHRSILVRHRDQQGGANNREVLEEVRPILKASLAGLHLPEPVADVRDRRELQREH